MSMERRTTTEDSFSSGRAFQRAKKSDLETCAFCFSSASYGTGHLKNTTVPDALSRKAASKNGCTGPDGFTCESANCNGTKALPVLPGGTGLGRAKAAATGTRPKALKLNFSAH